jgi:transcriptional regulator with XRE-family HTH domain
MVCAMSFAEQLRAAMAERGMTGRQLAQRVSCHPSLVCHFRSGRKRPSAKMAALFDAALGAGGELAQAARADDALPGRRSVLAGGGLLAGALLVGPDAADRLDWIARHPPAVDAAAVDALAEVLAGQRRADDLFGSAVMLRPVMAQLGVVENLVRQARGPVRPVLLDVAQQWAQFAGYQHRQIGDIAGDRDRMAQTMEWATEIGDRTMTGTVLLNRGEAALLAGEAGTVIGLAEAVQRDKAAAVGPRAHGADLEARGHALARDTAAAERCLGQAAELTTGLSDHDSRHPWLHWMSPADMHCKRGVSLGFLADDPRYHARAVSELEAGYAALPAEVRMTAWGAKYPAYLAVVHARAGDVGAACTAALQAARIARRTGPSLAQRLALQVHADLEAQYPGDQRVAGLAEALH